MKLHREKHGVYFGSFHHQRGGFIIIGELSGNNTIALHSCFGITLVIRLACIWEEIHLKKVEKESAIL